MKHPVSRTEFRLHIPGFPGHPALVGRRNIHRARSLRARATDAESLLWHRLRGGQLRGIHFRRQHPLGTYIVDFCAPEMRLVVELDGGQHDEDEELLRDRIRTRSLERRGYRVLRFWNHEVFQELEAVLERILQVAEERRQ